MIQVYFLSVALNLACGLALLLPERPHPRQLLRHLDFVLSDMRVRVALGVLGIVTGILTVVSPVQGDVPFVGDLIPAVTAALSGLAILFELHPGAAVAEAPLADPENAEAAKLPSTLKIRKVLVESGRVLGLAAILAGVVHFLFPLELFL